MEKMSFEFGNVETNLDSSEICRGCLRSTSVFESLFGNDDLTRKIEIISDVRITKMDNLPSVMCAECVININLAFNFRRVLIYSDIKIKKQLNEQLISSESPNDASVDDTRFNSPSIEDMSCELEKKNDGSRLDKNDKKFSKEVLITKALPPEKLVCDVCGKFVRFDNLKKHLTLHSDNPTSCDVCGKVFKNPELLRKHLYRHKAPSKACEYCGLLFKSASNILDHIRRTHTELIKSHHCHLCDKSFNHARELKKHIKSHTGERPHLCEYCQKGFTTTYALKTHLRRHTNERPYICEYCSVGFPQKVSLKNHLKSKHSDINL